MTEEEFRWFLKGKRKQSTESIERLNSLIHDAEKEFPGAFAGDDLGRFHELRVDTLESWRTGGDWKILAHVNALTVLMQQMVWNLERELNHYRAKKNAEGERTGNIEVHEDVIELGKRLAKFHESHEIVSLVYERKNGSPSKPTIRKILRKAGIYRK